MKNYFKMKKNKWKVKAMLYGLIVEPSENQKEAGSIWQMI